MKSMAHKELVALVNAFDAYASRQQGKVTLEGFCRDYLAQVETPPPSPAEKIHPGWLGRLMGRLIGYSNIYVKLALKDSGLNNITEFGFLGTLTEHESMRKSEIIQLMLTEFTSGIEMLKRMEREGLIEEFPDPEDKRSKRVKITPKGLQVWANVMQPMTQSSEIVFRPFEESEMEVLHRLFSKAVVVHDSAFERLGERTLEKAYEAVDAASRS